MHFTDFYSCYVTIQSPGPWMLNGFKSPSMLYTPELNFIIHEILQVHPQLNEAPKVMGAH